MEDESNLHQRIEQLEKRVAHLQQSLNQLQAAFIQQDIAPSLELPPSAQSDPSGPASAPRQSPGQPPVPPTVRAAHSEYLAEDLEQVPVIGSTPAPPSPSVARSVSPLNPTDWLQNWETWLNRLGIGLLLLGIGFLFMYAVEQGWLTSYVLVVLGLLIGAAFMGLGWRLRQQRPAFSQIFQGGGLATFYITGFAAFQFLNVFPLALAFPFMVLVTIGAFFIALKQQKAVFSVLGAIGGLATPFLLYSDDGNPGSLAIYTLLLLAGSLAVYWKQRWRSLLWTTFFLGWIVLLIAVSSAMGLVNGSGDRWVIQWVMGLTWLGYGLLPPLGQFGFRQRRRDANPSSLPQPSPSQLPSRVASGWQQGELIALVNPFFGLGWSALLWGWSESTAGWAFLAAGLVYFSLSFAWRSLPTSWRLLYLFTGLFLLLMAILLHLGGKNIVLVPLAGEALILHWLGHRYRSRWLTAIAHLFWAALGATLLGRLIAFSPVKPLIINPQSVIDLTVLGAAVVSARWLGSSTRTVYYILAHLLLLAWFQREFNVVAPGLVTFLWGLYGMGILVVGLRWDKQTARIVALLTLIVTIVRLFIIDLIDLEPIWRVLLFMGFGVLFLGVSYYFRALWRPTPSALSSTMQENRPPSSEDTSP
ncbi:DUF2339 domain-containing protein [Candidatus Synechococcus calcipolaris G9]|uniref:DUF2339 domain-containing protein n=1 Tax=Candidatus Synechococcus calcipolaris G9 TaxID=1497997 RepID=A0ABT6EWY8_9SYNE|nr:DUF2339 domain-containing protein [Candidatus Synechococcus calcipolaris]MDG2990300.1 DUF2339 domain-containing protein [Candidatus Synechococcus calcipolaris G9]